MGKILTRPELQGGATVNGVEVISADGDVVAPVTPDSVGLLSGHILVGKAGDVGEDVAMSGDVHIATGGATAIQPSVVTGQMAADAAGLPSATGFVKKYALAVYDFAAVGGTVGAITLPTASIPSHAVVYVDSYDVLTTLTSSTDAATVKVGLVTDGDLTTAIAISNGSNPWDAGAFSRIQGGLATPLTKKTTGARAVVVTVGVENVTAGKIVFNLSYWVSQ